jgi:hypothetical protein
MSGRATNKTIWNMGDVLDNVDIARQNLDTVITVAERQMDARLALAAAQIGVALNRIEKRARDARYNRYDEGVA